MSATPRCDLKRTIRVLHVVGLYPSPSNPSAQVFVKAQIDSLSACQVDCDVLVLAGRGVAKYLSAPAQIRARLRERPADLIHAHYSYCGWVSLGLGLPVVVSLLGTDLYGPLRRPRVLRRLVSLAHHRFAQRLANRAGATIVKSDRMRRDLGRPCLVIPNGVDLELFSPLADATEVALLRERLGFRSETALPCRYALFAGSAENPVKRHPLASAAVQWAETEIGSPVRLFTIQGRPQTEIADYMRAADLLLLTSSHEGSPNVVKEAIACNLPVVSVDVGDVRERLRDCRESVVVDDPSTETLGAAVAQVLRRGHRDSGSESLEPLGLSAIAKRVRAVYDDVLDPR